MERDGNKMSTEQQVEAILFFKGEPAKIKELSSILKISEGSIEEALVNLKEQLKGRGICLMEKDNSVMLGTVPELSELIEQIRKTELSRDIGRAGLETLSIILYKSPIGRSEIDYIRGVNSTFILRALMVRGLVERAHNPKDARSFLYKPTFELLSFLGISNVSELPNFDKALEELTFFAKEREEKTEDDREKT